MLESFSEFKFYQSFRIPVNKEDGIRCLVEKNTTPRVYIEDARLVDISVAGLGFATKERLSVGSELTFSIQFKKHHLDLSGRIVRAFSLSVEDQEMIYGVELEEDKNMRKMLEVYIGSFTPERLRESLVSSILDERYTKTSEGLEIFSLLLSLFKDITAFGERESFVTTMLDEVVRILNAQRASIFLINPVTNELEALVSLGVDKETLKFDYRKGIAGSVFTTGIALNIDTERDHSRYNSAFDEISGFKTKSIICYPIHNGEDKTIGVIEVINKRNQDHFTLEDEKTMKVLSLVFSTVFHQYNPSSELSKIRKFSAPFDREHALIGKAPSITELRGAIVKTKDLDTPLLITGEFGVGKTLYAKIIHYEGKRGLNRFETIEAGLNDQLILDKEFFGRGDLEACKPILCKSGTLLIRNIEMLSLSHQKQLMQMIRERRVPNTNMSIDVRFLASTSCDLIALSEEGSFDRDLAEYFATSIIHMEPLRARLGDIPYLVNYFLKTESKRQGLLLKSFSPEILEELMEYDYSRNVFELRQIVERAVLYNPKAHVITSLDLKATTLQIGDSDARRGRFGDIAHVTNHSISLKDRIALVEREMILEEIKRLGGNKSKAAISMGISREALRKKLIISDEILAELENKNTVADKSDRKRAA